MRPLVGGRPKGCLALPCASHARPPRRSIRAVRRVPFSAGVLHRRPPRLRRRRPAPASAVTLRGCDARKPLSFCPARRLPRPARGKSRAGRRVAPSAGGLRRRCAAPPPGCPVHFGIAAVAVAARPGGPPRAARPCRPSAPVASFRLRQAGSGGDARRRRPAVRFARHRCRRGGRSTGRSPARGPPVSSVRAARHVAPSAGGLRRRCAAPPPGCPLRFGIAAIAAAARPGGPPRAARPCRPSAPVAVFRLRRAAAAAMRGAAARLSGSLRHRRHCGGRSTGRSPSRGPPVPSVRAGRRVPPSAGGLRRRCAAPPPGCPVRFGIAAVAVAARPGGPLARPARAVVGRRSPRSALGRRAPPAAGVTAQPARPVSSRLVPNGSARRNRPVGLRRRQPARRRHRRPSAPVVVFRLRPMCSAFGQDAPPSRRAALPPPARSRNAHPPNPPPPCGPPPGGLSSASQLRRPSCACWPPALCGGRQRLRRRYPPFRRPAPVRGDDAGTAPRSEPVVAPRGRPSTSIRAVRPAWPAWPSLPSAVGSAAVPARSGAAAIVRRRPAARVASGLGAHSHAALWWSGAVAISAPERSRS